MAALQSGNHLLVKKLVSDSLDVGQIFFNIEKYRKQIEIIVWDKTTDLAELLESDNDAHQRLGKTYATFLQQDGSQYNFNQMDCIYLLNYIDPSSTKEMDIIGATSPATLFFTSANDLEYVGKKISQKEAFYKEGTSGNATGNHCVGEPFKKTIHHNKSSCRLILFYSCCKACAIGENGTNTFSFSTSILKNAEQLRFGKNGVSSANSKFQSPIWENSL